MADDEKIIGWRRWWGEGMYEDTMLDVDTVSLFDEFSSAWKPAPPTPRYARRRSVRAAVRRAVARGRQ